MVSVSLKWCILDKLTVFYSRNYRQCVIGQPVIFLSYLEFLSKAGPIDTYKL